MPGIVLVCLLAICALQAVRFALGYAPSPAWRNLPTGEMISYRVVIVAFNIVGSLVQIPIMIGVHRCILLANTETTLWYSNFRSRYLRYFFYMTIFTIASLVVGSVQYSRPLGTILSFPLYLFYLYISVRSCLIFSAIAIDRPKIDFVDLFQRTKGKFWRALSIFLLTSLPMIAILVLVMLSRRLEQPSAFVVELLLTGIAELGGAVLLASAASQIYRFIGNDDPVPNRASSEGIDDVEADAPGLMA